MQKDYVVTGLRLPFTRGPATTDASTRLGHVGIYSGRIGIADVYGHARQQADYLIHAANAYPKLVAALREIHALGVAKAKAGELTVCERTMRERAFALLRELGEAE